MLRLRQKHEARGSDLIANGNIPDDLLVRGPEAVAEFERDYCVAARHIAAERLL